MDPILTPMIIGGSLLLFALGSRRKFKKPSDIDLPDVDDPDAPDDPEKPTEPSELEQRITRITQLVDEYISPVATPGKLYPIKYGDNLSDVARAALDTISTLHTNQQRLHYIHCLSSGPLWNLRFYGTPSTSKVFPEMYLVPGIGMGIRVAFLPRNQDAVGEMFMGRMPRMTVDPETGAPAGGDHYGLLWLPPVASQELVDGNMPSCAPFSWADGSSTIDPDPELLSLLEAA
jgi:hypothetical protein